MGTRLQTSFAALYLLLERPRVARRVVAGLLVIHTLLLGYSAYVHSPTLNEPGHLVAGLSYWKFGRFDVYNVNPPLVRMVAALPVMAAGYKEDWSGFYEGPGARPEMKMGEDFVAANGERSFFLFMIARWACIPFSWLGAIVCYLWACDLYGRPSGVMAASIWCFEPNILGHASLITPDAPATALGLAASYTFWRWLKLPSWSLVVLAGLILGLAELAKTTLLLFYAIWPVAWVSYRCCQHNRTSWLREGTMLVVTVTVSLYVLNAGYGFEGTFTNLKDFEFVGDFLSGTELGLSVVQNSFFPLECRSLGRDRSSPTDNSDFLGDMKRGRIGNRFIHSVFGDIKIPLPKNYLLGIDLQQKDFDHYGHPSYLNGVWQYRGWWYYYLYAYGIKSTLGLWIIVIWVLISRIAVARSAPKRNAIRRTLQEVREGKQRTIFDEIILLVPAATLFCVVSAQFGFSEHMRYAMPSFPYMFIGASQIAHRLRRVAYAREVDGEWEEYREFGCQFNGSFVAPRSLAVAITMTYCCVSSLMQYPHSLCYFSEIVGGPLNGPNYLLGSSANWGQDLLYLIDKVDRTNARPLFTSLYGSYSLMSVGLKSSTMPIELNDGRMSPGWYAISVDLLLGCPRIPRSGRESCPPISLELLSRLREMQPVFYAGPSIYVYFVGRP